MKVIGITGSSGSGKTLIASIIKEQYNADLINADQIVKNESQKGTDYYKAIVKCFGKEILDENGNLDKKKLANIIYESKISREKLNQITYKYIVDEIKSKIYSSKNDIVVVDAPLLFESDLNKLCNIVIAVIADEEVKINRICTRDNIDRKLAKKRLNIQATDKFYIKNADYIIKNGKGKKKEELISKICMIIGKS